MERPENIPQDVWGVAISCYDLFRAGYSNDARLPIALAILAERKRCAKVADDYADDLRNSGELYGCEDVYEVARAILKPSATD